MAPQRVCRVAMALVLRASVVNRALVLAAHLRRALRSVGRKPHPWVQLAATSNVGRSRSRTMPARRLGFLEVTARRQGFLEVAVLRLACLPEWVVAVLRSEVEDWRRLLKLLLLLLRLVRRQPPLLRWKVITSWCPELLVRWWIPSLAKRGHRMPRGE